MGVKLLLISKSKLKHIDLKSCYYGCFRKSSCIDLKLLTVKEVVYLIN